MPTTVAAMLVFKDGRTQLNEIEHGNEPDSITITVPNTGFQFWNHPYKLVTFVRKTRPKDLCPIYEEDKSTP